MNVGRVLAEDAVAKPLEGGPFAEARQRRAGGLPDFRAGIAAAMLLRVANADVLPYDYVEYATTMRGDVASLTRAANAKGMAVCNVSSSLRLMRVPRLGLNVASVCVTS